MTISKVIGQTYSGLSKVDGVAKASISSINGQTAGGSINPDAQAFLTATGIVDATITTAINDLVNGLQADSLWAKCVAIYPYVGGTATTHKYNLKNPVDTDGGFRITFSGGVTHNANGITGNSLDGDGNTHVNSSSDLAQNSRHLSVYVRNNVDQGFDMGNPALIDVLDILGALNGGLFYGYLSDLGGHGVSNTDSRGFWNTSRVNGTEINFYERGVPQGANPVADPSSPMASQTIYMLRGLTQFTSHNHAFASIGSGLSNADAANLYTLVQAFQTTLGRQV